MPPPLHLWEIPAEAEASPPAPSALLPHFSHLLRPSLGPGQAATALENNTQRKKKKKLPVHDQRNLAFLAWLAAFCAPPFPMEDAIPPVEQREDVPCLPSWRGFVFFPLPPPLFS